MVCRFHSGSVKLWHTCVSRGSLAQKYMTWGTSPVAAWGTAIAATPIRPGMCTRCVTAQGCQPPQTKPGRAEIGGTYRYGALSLHPPAVYVPPHARGAGKLLLQLSS